MIVFANSKRVSVSVVVSKGIGNRLCALFLGIVSTAFVPGCATSGADAPKSMESIELSTLSDNRSLLCLPGCALEADTQGELLVPEWCSAWVKQRMEVCSVTAGGEQSCFFEDARPVTAEAEAPGYCIQIALDKLSLGTGAYAKEETRLGRLRRLGTENLPQSDKSGASVRCLPGCLVNQGQYALQRSEEEKMPDWCEELWDGRNPVSFLNYFRDNRRSIPVGNGLARCESFDVKDTEAGDQ